MRMLTSGMLTWFLRKTEWDPPRKFSPRGMLFDGNEEAFSVAYWEDLCYNKKQGNRVRFLFGRVLMG